MSSETRNKTGDRGIDFSKMNLVDLRDEAVRLAREEKFAEAIAMFRAALDREPNHVQTWRNLAIAYTKCGRASEAEKCFAKEAEIDPSSSAIQIELAKARRKLKRFAAAERASGKAVELDSTSAEAHFEHGITLAAAEKYDKAVAAYKRAIELKPDYADAYNNLGVSYQRVGRLEEAISNLRKATELRPGNASAHNNLGVALAEQQEHEEAMECYHRALAIDSKYVLGWSNLGNALRTMGRNQDAILALEQALTLKPDYAEAHNNIAIAFLQNGEPERALQSYNRALMLRPRYAEARMNRALIWLGTCRFDRGWSDYEWRWQLKSMKPKRLASPRWDGGPLVGKRILVRFEQGLGDTFHFIRYMAELKARGATVIFEDRAETREILSRTPGIDEFVVKGSKLPRFDCYTCLLSVPGHLGACLENIIAPIPYIFTGPQLIQKWTLNMQGLKGLRVGIAWQGSTQHRGDRMRSIPLAKFHALARVEGVRLVSLQRGFGSEQVAALHGAFDLETFDGVDDADDGFLRTAAIIKNLDLVVTIDTAVAHLAGAMGVPVWIALPAAPDWRWMRDREDSPWYPTVRLFRQRRQDDWDHVFERICTALQERTLEKSRSFDGAARNAALSQELLRAGNRLIAENQLALAQEKFEAALAANNCNADAHHDLGVALAKQKQLEGAIGCFRRSLELSPKSQRTYGNMGLAFLHNNQIEEAIWHLRKSISLGGSSAETYNNLGVALMGVPRHEKASECYLQAVYLEPDYAIAHYNLARTLLAMGDFEQGWLEYEWRMECPGAIKREFSEPRWTGSPLKGQTVLLHEEHGFGTIIQFVRYASVVRESGAGRVIVECDKRWVALLKQAKDVDQVVTATDPLPPFDLHAPLLSLPVISGTTLKSVPANIPYIVVDSEEERKWEDELHEVQRLRVGIAWQESFLNDGNHLRSVPLIEFAELANIEGVHLVSLLPGFGDEQVAALNGAFELETFDGMVESSDSLVRTAAIIENLDLVVTVDCTVAHLAGAMGALVWVLLPAAADWPWLRDREDSPWYPTMRLFRQRRQGDWNHVFENLASELKKLAAGSITLTSSADSRILHRRGLEELRAGKLGAATDCFSEAVRLDPEDGLAHHDLGVVLARSRKPQDAIVHFRTALQIQPSIAGCHGNLALALLEVKDYAGALKACNEGIGARHESPTLRFRMANALIGLGQLDDAMESLQAALQLEPGFAETYKRLADVQQLAGDNSAAEEAYRQAIQIKADFPEAERGLALILVKGGKFTEAAERCHRLLQRRPNDTEILKTLADSLVAIGRDGEAIRTLERAVYISPEDQDARKRLGQRLLSKRELNRGFLEYSWTGRTSQGRLNYKTRWDGAQLTGRTLLVVAEDSAEDAILLLRYVRTAKEQVGRLVVACGVRLVELFGLVPEIDQIVNEGAKAQFDFWSPLAALPVLLGACADKSHNVEPYLFLEYDSKSLAAADDAKVLLALSTQSPTAPWYKQPHFLEQFVQAFWNESCASIAAGYPVEAFLDGLPVRPGLNRDRDNWTELSRSFVRVDLVVTDDISIAQLAAAFGIKVLLPLGAIASWHLNCDQGVGYWYPSMRIIRESEVLSWRLILATATARPSSSINLVPATVSTPRSPLAISSQVGSEPSKVAVVTLATTPEFEKLAETTFPSQLRYALRIKADSVVLKKRVYSHPHYDKWQLYDLLAHYDRIVFLDADTIVRPDCPNLFSMVPESHFAGENELVSFPGQRENLKAFLQAAGMSPLACPYYLNGGVIVASKQHRDIFRPPEVVLLDVPWPEQSHLNARLIGENVPVKFLSSAFNDRHRRNSYHRSSFILHYSVMPINKRIESAKRDLEEWSRLFPNPPSKSQQM